ncbi:MAG: tRNA (adenosine(37)-N6)-dimethylallyltransferase MiaA [Alphaproteobacteria bacterium]|nr:tRNA (adenosine(37)-N6)-dimethylallyltransferase MiaA [Alphaproteobacteria bacterium]
MNATSVIIAGPTASGKSDLAHRLAMRTGGVIINCDSVQIYRGIENISASPFADRPITDDIDGVPYKLFSILPLTEQISVADYLNLARREYDAAVGAGRMPIFVGGTGFYINAIINGLSPMPDVSDDARRRARDMVAENPDAARAMLGPDCPADPQRMARALEVLLETGHPLSHWQKLPRRGAIVPCPTRILVNPPRDVLLPRIAARIPQMMAGGALDEARAVIASGWDENRAIGAAQLCRYLRGEIDADACNENWIVRTNQYAKRQRTWFRTQFDADIEITNAPTDGDVDALVQRL